VLRAGGVFVPINPLIKGDKLAFILRDCSARVLITSARLMKGMEKQLAGSPDLCHIVLVDRDASAEATTQLQGADQRLRSLSEVVAPAGDTALASPNIDLDLASLIYTSGSTGVPKGVMLTHLNMVTAVSSLTTYLRSERSDVVLSPLPLSFDYGLYQVLMATAMGSCVVLEKSFLYPYRYVQLIATERVTGLPLVPTISAILLNLKDLDSHDFSSVTFITNTAQALPVHHIRRLRATMPNARIYSMYGLTECKRVAYLPPELIDKKPTSVGIAIPNTEVWIEDDDGRLVTGPSQTGELIVRGAHVMTGYWNRPDETAQRLRPGRTPYERELKTGDLFRYDEEGHLYFISRRDDLIKTGGERVAPREIENVLYELDAVKEAAVVAVPDEILGNAIKAVVSLHSGKSLSEVELIRHCQERLERFMVPKHVAFMPDLPKTASGKISKRELIGAV